MGLSGPCMLCFLHPLAVGHYLSFALSKNIFISWECLLQIAYLALYLAYNWTELTLFEAWLMINLSFEQHPKNFFQPPKIEKLCKKKQDLLSAKGLISRCFQDGHQFLHVPET